MNEIKTNERGIRGEQSSFIEDQAAFVAESKEGKYDPRSLIPTEDETASIELTEEEIGSLLAGLRLIGPLDGDGVNDIGDPLEIGTPEALYRAEEKLEASLKGFPLPIDLWFAKKYLHEQHARSFGFFGCKTDAELASKIREAADEENETSRAVNRDLIADGEEPREFFEVNTKAGLTNVLDAMLGR